jgi:hypothetical protein
MDGMLPRPVSHAGIIHASGIQLQNAVLVRGAYGFEGGFGYAGQLLDGGFCE